MPNAGSELLRKIYCSCYHDEICPKCQKGKPPLCIDNTQMSIISRFLCTDESEEKVLPIQSGQNWIIDPQKMSCWKNCDQVPGSLPEGISLLKNDNKENVTRPDNYSKLNTYCVATAMLYIINQRTTRPNNIMNREYDKNWLYLLLLSPKVFVEGMFNIFYAFQRDICQNTNRKLLCEQLIKNFSTIASILNDEDLFREVRSKVSNEF